MSGAAKRRWQNGLILALAAGLSMGGFLLMSAHFFRIGFPLDDAWIHQTYARNLGELGEWSFMPGEPSGGSTAPLWSALLAVGYLFSMPPLGWAFLLGWGCLLAVGLVGEGLFRAHGGALNISLPWMGLFLVAEWHLVWAAASGMETLLHALVILGVLAALTATQPRWGWVGAAIGLAVWVRPDGVTLLGPALFVLGLTVPSWRNRLERGAKLASGFLAGFIPYLWFNYNLSGSVWPNTFYAKQAEYAILYEFPLIERLVDLFRLSLIGAGALLLPGLIYGVAQAFRRRDWSYLAGFLWWAGYTVLYALRLPVIYQHGRYLIPAMPVYFVLGAVGLVQWAGQAPKFVPLHRVIGRAWGIAIVLLAASFYALGARAYAEDVAVIESEMVAAANWVRENTPPDALIAAHDIGAMGYLAERNLLDLAGLVSPEVIPFIRDEDRLAEYISAQGGDYLVTFPGGYSRLRQYGVEVFDTGAPFSPALGSNNIRIYRWPK